MEVAADRSSGTREATEIGFEDGAIRERKLVACRSQCLRIMVSKR